MAKLDGWIHTDGNVKMAKPKQVRVTDMANYVAVQLRWPAKGFEIPDGDDKALQIGFTPDQALKIADALRQSAERAQAAADKAQDTKAGKKA